jgi:hypothetical protein
VEFVPFSLFSKSWPVRTRGGPRDLLLLGDMRSVTCRFT